MKFHEVKKRTAACDELSRVEPKNNDRLVTKFLNVLVDLNVDTV